MPRYAKIIVEKGAQLILDGPEAHITNTQFNTWEGIYVHGDKNQNQLIGYANSPNPGCGLNQGTLRMKNGATISHALTAVRLYGAYSRLSKTGGIVIASNSFFLNNRVDVEFQSYPLTFGSASRFDNCEFKVDAAIGNNYKPYARVKLWDIKGVQFYKDKFDYQAGLLFPDGGIGIESFDAIYTVSGTNATRTSFTNFRRGIVADNTNPVRPPHITYTKFDNNNLGALFHNVYNLVFSENELFLGDLSFDGVYLHSCKYYNIRNNLFEENYYNQTCAGISAFQSEFGVHQIYRNTFSNLGVGIGALADNSGIFNSNPRDGLKMNCNQFSLIPNKWDIALKIENIHVQTPTGIQLVPINPTIMKIQGKTIPPIGPLDVVRNIYGAPSMCPTCENKFHIQGTSPKQIDHGSNHPSSINTHPTPQPAFGDVAVHDVPSNIILDYAEHCEPWPSSTGGDPSLGSNRLVNMNSYLTSLRAENFENDKHNEIQATVASKINYFLTDTIVGSLDSVITIFETNQGNMEDADVLSIFASMNKSDLIAAADKAADLPPEKNDWKVLLLKVIELEEDSEKVFHLEYDEADRNFFQTYASLDDKYGHAVAKSILKHVFDQDYAMPRILPLEETGGRTMNVTNLNEKAENQTIQAYPNPVIDKVKVRFRDASKKYHHIEIKDVLGKTVFNETIGQTESFDILLRDVEPGVYFLKIETEDREEVFKGKFIKAE